LSTDDDFHLEDTMRTWTIVLAALALVLTPPGAKAQSASAWAGWAGLITTPVGGLPPAVVVPAEGATPKWSVRARYGRWSFPQENATTNLGVGIAFPAGKTLATVEVAHMSTENCSDCGAILVGAELNVPLATTPLSGTGADDESTFEAAVEPAVGFMTVTASGVDATAVSMAVSLPLSITIPVGAKARLAPFVSPGAGLGHIGGGGDSETGTRMMVGFGVGLVAGRVQVTGAARKIFIEQGPTLYGLSVSIGG
jgi:hypothetical protein